MKQQGHNKVPNVTLNAAQTAAAEKGARIMQQESTIRADGITITEKNVAIKRMISVRRN